jgi:alpha-tubulin suppressor-like RCC1 family protein
MPNPNTNFKNSNGTDLGNIIITKEYLMTVYPQIAANMITPELWTWGSGGSGNLGNNQTLARLTPITTSAGGANWKQVSCGQAHTAAIKTDGTLWTWGYNSFGQVGNNQTTDSNIPVTTFAGGTNWKQVSCGYRFTAAIKTDGTLWTWGFNAGQIGDNTTTNRSIPVTTFAGGTNWKQVSGGQNHTAAIKTDGTLWVWGSGSNVRLGTNDTTSRLTPVTTFAGGTNWKQVACGYEQTAAIKTDGTLWVWGYNIFAHLGTNDTTNRSTPVTTFAGGTNWKQVSGGQRHTVAIKTDGTLWGWGTNFGMLGTNDTINRSTPVTTFAGGTNWKQVACGYLCTTAIKTDGTLWGWGFNSGGQLGINDNSGNYVTTPVTTFAGGTNWKQVEAGKQCTAAIKTSDDLIGI